ncbi:MAG: ornithine carbamoyltransferase [Actinomycetota bacterium]
MTRHFLRDDDLSPAEQAQVLDLALRLKDDRFLAKPLQGPKTVAVIFDKTSTRTRVSFAVGIADLGGMPLIIDSQGSQMGVKESVADTARVLERTCATIVWRTYEQSGLEKMAENTTVPVINALSDDFHPCQLLADLQTIREHKGDLAGLTVAFLGDGASNMGQSYLLACATAGINIRIGAPEGYQPREDIVVDARAIAAQTGGSVTIVAAASEAVTGADIVVTDTWASMGKEDQKAQRIIDFAGYQVDAELMGKAKPDAIFMHCLPAYRGYEVSAEVLDGPQSVIWDEAENRLHAQKALMVWLLQKSAAELVR